VRFETLIERYHDEIYAYLWRLVEYSSPADPLVGAEDLAQEVFLRAYGAFERLRPGSNYRAWLYRIATNCAYSALKRRRIADGRTTPLPEEDEAVVIPSDSRPGPLAVITGRERQSTLEAALSSLPAKQQAAVVMRHVHELEYDEIAQALNCTEDSARANVYQGLKRMRGILGEEENYYEEDRKL